MGEIFFIQRKEQIPHLTQRVEDVVQANNVVTLNVKVGKTRTAKQQSALEVWCRQVAELFNELGLDFAVHSSVFRDGEIECSWTQASVKDHVWRVMQRHIAGIESSADCKTTDYPKIYDELVKAFANKSISLPQWPIRFEVSSGS